MVAADLLSLVPASRLDEDGRIVVTVDGRAELAIELQPRPGTLCRADLPDLDGYRLEVAGAGGGPGPAPAAALLGDGFTVVTDDPDLTWSLLDDVRAELLVLPGRGLRLHVEDDVAEVRGARATPAAVATAVGLLAVVCARPYQLARRLARLLRRWGGVATGPRWNAVDFRIDLATSPPLAVDWPRRRGPSDPPGLVTRLRVETARDVPTVHVVDVAHVAPPPGLASPIVGASARAGRYHVVAATAAGVATGLTLLDPAIGALLDAAPRRLTISPSGVEVMFAGIELQPAALAPGIELARQLAGSEALVSGPYR